MMKRVPPGKHECRNFLPPRSIRLIVHRPASLVFYDISLRIELLLRHRRQKSPHSIRFEPECKFQLIRWYRLEVVGALEPGTAVQRSARTLHKLEVFIRTDVFRALKQHVLEEMCESRPSFFLVRRPYVIPQ